MADSAATSNASPGEILRGARELYGWSLEEVAAELNLLPDVVEELEADDYSHTAGWTYAVGYLRNYARLAGVSIEQAIADRRELLPPKEDGPGTMTEGTPNKPQPVPIQYRWVVTAVVLILVIGGLYAAYLNRASDVERVRVDLAEESRSQAGTEEAGESASTDSAEQAPSQPALAVTLTPSEEDGVSESTPTPAVPTEPSDADESPTVAATPEVPSLTVDAETATDSPAGAAAQTPASPSAPAEPEKKKKVAVSTATTVTAKASEPKVQEKAKPKSTSASSSASGSKPASQTGAAKSKQKVTKTKQPGTTASVERRLLNPEFSTALSSMPNTADSASTRPLTADSRGITLKVQESTHVVVWDRDNVELFRRYVEGGKVVSLVGKPPFTLLVSYPDGAKIVYGGREFSIPVGRSGRNAKVRVGR
ncbi:MAG TPA: hypothetical protein DG761_08145 [Gammaproteobacteria bacterium]|nr:hypothetical protein [Gammaproteobacteria bacterium]